MAMVNNTLRDSNSFYSETLRLYMVKVFMYMFVALATTSFTSVSILSTNAITYLMNAGGGLSPLGWLLTLSPLVFAIIFGTQLHKMSTDTAFNLLLVYSVVMGAAISPTLYHYTGISVARVFLITSITFLAMSIYGYTTKKNLATWGSFLFMGLIGVIIASLVNIFFQSSTLYFVVSIITVLIFTGFTAYDVQRLKYLFDSTNNADKDKAAVIGALALYMDFINIFMSLLHLLGEKRR